MKNNYFKILALTFLISQFSFSQQMPIDFSDSADNFSTWGGSGFSKGQSPTDSNNTVGQFFKDPSTGEQGIYIDLSRSIDLDFQKTITLSFYRIDNDNDTHTIGLKLEHGGVNPDIQVNVNAASHGIWTQLTFDFSTVSGAGKYDRLTVIIDNGSTTTGTFLIDNIDDGSTPVVSPPDPVYDYLIWSDEFDTAGNNNPINTTKWFHQTQLPAGGSWYNNEQQHYTNRTENSFVENGFLNIVAKKENFTDQGHTKAYTSARLNSKFAFTYGKVEVRAKLPAGVGTWPAIWSLGKNISESGAYWQTQGFGTTSWPACGEIDIMEHWGTNQNHVQSAMHTPSSFGGTVNYGGQTIPTASTAFHDYVLEWYPDKMVFSVDGNVHYTYQPATRNSSTWPFIADQYLLLNIAIQSSILSSYTQSTMVIDYVRVYQSSPLSVGDINKSDIKVFPNPANLMININAKVPLDRVEVYDVLGKLMFSESKNTKNLDISSLKPGLYILNIYSGSNKTIKKIVVN